MSVPAALHRPRGIPWSRRVTARIAVGLAHLLKLLPPRHMRKVLTMVRRGAKPADYATAKAARDAVTSVSLACLGTKGCLPRSLATTLLCRMTGSWPTWCAGPSVHPPFTAHAWVQAEGRMVDEPFPDGYFARLITVPPLAREEPSR
jgi:Transglutaminase-like superfamily